MQKEICKLVGARAKSTGSKKNWKRDGLFWQGKPIDRYSEEYQILLDRAFDALSQNSAFAAALLSTKDATLTHSMGKIKQSETILTRTEFCGRLTTVRTRLQNTSKQIDK